MSSTHPSPIVSPTVAPGHSALDSSVELPVHHALIFSSHSSIEDEFNASRKGDVEEKVIEKKPEHSKAKSLKRTLKKTKTKSTQQRNKKIDVSDNISVSDSDSDFGPLSSVSQRESSSCSSPVSSSSFAVEPSKPKGLKAAAKKASKPRKTKAKTALKPKKDLKGDSRKLPSFSNKFTSPALSKSVQKRTQVLPQWYENLKRDAKKFPTEKLVDYDLFVGVINRTRTVESAKIHCTKLKQLLTVGQGEDQILVQSSVSAILFNNAERFLAFFNRMLQDGLNPSTRQNYHRTFIQLCQSAVQGLTRTPADLIVLAQQAEKLVVKFVDHADQSRNRHQAELRSKINQSKIGTVLTLKKHTKLFKANHDELVRLVEEGKKIGKNRASEAWRKEFCMRFAFSLFLYPERPSFWTKMKLGDITFMNDTYYTLPETEKSIALQNKSRKHYIFDESFNPVMDFYLSQGRALLLGGKQSDAFLIHYSGTSISESRLSAWFRKALIEYWGEPNLDLRGYRSRFQNEVMHDLTLTQEQRNFITQQLRHTPLTAQKYYQDWIMRPQHSVFTGFLKPKPAAVISSTSSHSRSQAKDSVERIELSSGEGNEEELVSKTIVRYIAEMASKGNLSVIRQTLSRLSPGALLSSKVSAASLLDVLKSGESAVMIGKHLLTEALASNTLSDTVCVCSEPISLDQRPIESVIREQANARHKKWFSFIYGCAHFWSLWIDFEKKTIFYYDSLSNPDHTKDIQQFIKVYSSCFKSHYHVQLENFQLKKVRGGKQDNLECSICAFNTMLCVINNETIPKQYEPNWELKVRLTLVEMIAKKILNRQ